MAVHNRATSEPEAALRLAGELHESLSRLMRRLRSEHGFPLAQGTVLGMLDREGRKSVSELAAAARVRPQSMAQTVRELEDAGLVQRSPDPDDGRRAFVELTAPGLTALAADRRRRDGWIAQMIESDMSARERRLLREALALLDRLADS